MDPPQDCAKAEAVGWRPNKAQKNASETMESEGRNDGVFEGFVSRGKHNLDGLLLIVI